MKKILFIVFLAFGLAFSSHAKANSSPDDASLKFKVTSENTLLQVMNIPPVIEMNAVLSTEINTSVTFCPTISDANIGDVLTVSICDMPVALNGTVTADTLNCVTYEPDMGFVGRDTFCVSVCDQTGLCDSIMLSLCVEPAPEIVGDFSVCPGETVVFSTTDFTPGNSYSWSVNENATINSITDNQVEITFDDNPGSSTELVLIESAGASCEAIAFANISIEDNLPLTCNNGVNLSLNSSCLATITPDMVLEGQEYPDDSYTIILVDASGNELPSNVVGANYINQTLEVQVIHDCSGNFCWGFVTIEDKIAPILDCPADQILTCDEYANFSPIEPTIVGTACGDESLEFTVNEIEGTCDSTFAYYVTYTYTATDQSGNVSDPCS